MRIEEILSMVQYCKVGIIAPNEKESKLVFDRFLVSGLVPEDSEVIGDKICIGNNYVEFLTPDRAQQSFVDYFIVEFPDMIPEPDMNMVSKTDIDTELVTQEIV